VAPSATSEISSIVFMGNFVLFMSLLAGIFLVHIGLASAVEAYWLSKVRTALCRWPASWPLSHVLEASGATELVVSGRVAWVVGAVDLFG